MTADNFKTALKKVLIHEGGYVDDPRDPGGATNQGVTQRIYDAWRKGKKQSPRPVKRMEDSERDAIYRHQYWDAIQADKLPPGVDYVVFDGAVNSGPKQSIKWLQRALAPLYTGAIDGVMGLATLAALAAVNSLAGLIDRICDRRLAFLKALKTWKTFGRGWAARVGGVRVAGKALAAGRDQIAAVAFVPGGAAKARLEDAKLSPAKAPGDVATGAGVGAGGIAGTLQTLQDQLTPFSAAGDWIANLVVALAVGGALLAVGGIAYRWWGKRREAALADALDEKPV